MVSGFSGATSALSLGPASGLPSSASSRLGVCAGVSWGPAVDAAAAGGREVGDAGSPGGGGAGCAPPAAAGGRGTAGGGGHRGGRGGRRCARGGRCARRGRRRCRRFVGARAAKHLVLGRALVLGVGSGCEEQERERTGEGGEAGGASRKVCPVPNPFP